MSQVTVEQRGARWVARCPYEAREIPKAAGFRWDRNEKCWYTTDASIAERLGTPEAQQKALESAQNREAQKVAAIASSRATSADVELPVPDGLSYLPYQRAGIAYALTHESVLFGDEMGLGKTIQAIGTINADQSIKTVLVICPAGLKLNWYRELQKWLTRPSKILVGSGKPAVQQWEPLFRALPLYNQERQYSCDERTDVHPASDSPAPLSFTALDAGVGLARLPNMPQSTELSDKVIDNRSVCARKSDREMSRLVHAEPTFAVDNTGRICQDRTVIGNADDGLSTAQDAQGITSDSLIVVPERPISNSKPQCLQMDNGGAALEALESITQSHIADSRRSCHIEILIVNYDILSKWSQLLESIALDTVCIDEMHYCKNPDAKRTQLVVGKDAKKEDAAVPGIQARRRIGLTGTPIPNRPIEGWPIFHYLAPSEFRSFFGYAKQFCNAHNNGYGWDFSGASNLAQLQDKLRASMMIRRKKADVLTELPAKRRQVVELAQNGAAAAIKAETDMFARHEALIEELRAAVELSKASDNPQDYIDAVARLREAAGAAFTEMSKVRHDTAIAKLPYVIAHLEDALSEEGHKVVCFAHHTDVLDALKAAFPEAVMVRGDVAMQARQDAVDRFQNNPACTLFLGNIQAAGVGLTLTAASHVVFAELDWVPGNVTQAEDRCHRIGQRECVLIQHLVLEGSIDARMANTLVSKQYVIDEALDNERVKLIEEPATPARERAATESITRDKLGELAAQLTPEQIALIHRGLQILASMDEDHARDLNGMGFNKLDTRIGCELAARPSLTPRQAALGSKFVNKYRRQLPPDLVAQVRPA